MVVATLVPMRDVMLPRRKIVDEGPTFAKLLGVELNGAQGSPMEALLKN